MGVLDTLNSIPWFPDVAITLGTVFLLVGVQVLVLQPRMQITRNTKINQPCPDRWQQDDKEKTCTPMYRTSCRKFRTDEYGIKTQYQQCEFAKNCGTNWGGACQ